MCGMNPSKTAGSTHMMACCVNIVHMHDSTQLCLNSIDNIIPTSMSTVYISICWLASSSCCIILYIVMLCCIRMVPIITELDRHAVYHYLHITQYSVTCCKQHPPKFASSNVHAMCDRLTATGSDLRASAILHAWYSNTWAEVESLIGAVVQRLGWDHWNGADGLPCCGRMLTNCCKVQ